MASWLSHSILPYNYDCQRWKAPSQQRRCFFFYRVLLFDWKNGVRPRNKGGKSSSEWMASRAIVSLDFTESIYAGPRSRLEIQPRRFYSPNHCTNKRRNRNPEAAPSCCSGSLFLIVYLSALKNDTKDEIKGGEISIFERRANERPTTRVSARRNDSRSITRPNHQSRTSVSQ